MFIALDAKPKSNLKIEATNLDEDGEADAAEVFAHRNSDEQKETPNQLPEVGAQVNNRVFISHGKNRAIVDQLKQILSYGGFEPEPIPEKVMADMRACSFAVIPVSPEKE